MTAELVAELRRAGVRGVDASDRRRAEYSSDASLYRVVPQVVAFPRAEIIQEVARTTHLDRVLVETDAPFLAPPPHRGKRNEPAFVAHTAARVAELRGMDRADFERQTGENFFRLFTRVQRPAA